MAIAAKKEAAKGCEEVKAVRNETKGRENTPWIKFLVTRR